MQSTHEPAPSQTLVSLHCEPASSNPAIHVPSMQAIVLQSVAIGQSFMLAHAPPDKPAPDPVLDEPPLPSCEVVKVKQPAAITKATPAMERLNALESCTLISS